MASAIASGSTYIFPSSSSSSHFSHSTLIPPQHTHLESGNEEEDSEEEDSQDDETKLQQGLSEDEEVELKYSNSTKRKGKNWVCEYKGCGKSYTRRTRLEEHERTHTGERPFQCSECSSSFTRDSHLKAHLRSHSSDSEKKYDCQEIGCDKKFWTNQHLKKHIEVAHRGKTYDCTQCDEKFRKHHQLRSHFAEVHCTPGTKPFLCEHPGCDRSFAQKVHLKAHVKTHDPSRYVCLHPDCASLPLASRQFPVWSNLQKHTKSAHPPKCPYPICKGKTFTTQRGLKNHLQIHEREEAKGVEGKDFADPKQRSNVKRKRSERRNLNNIDKKPEAGEGEGEMLKIGDVLVEGFDESTSEWEERQENERDERMRQDFRIGGKKKRKVYEDSNGLTQTQTGGGPSPRVFDDFPLSNPYALPPPFDQDPLSSTLLPFPPPSSSFEMNPFSLPEPPLVTPYASTSSQYLDLLTGSNYHQPAPSQSHSHSHSHSRSNSQLVRKYKCPFPSILALPFHPTLPTTTSLNTGEEGQQEEEEEDQDQDEGEGVCGYWFKRIYDLERHLKSRHGVEMVGGKDTLRDWFDAGIEREG